MLHILIVFLFLVAVACLVFIVILLFCGALNHEFYKKELVITFLIVAVSMILAFHLSLIK
jgi:hypothetical protein